ncbi:hypothetical protein ARMGADRAFT_682627 [Armillaria gallica]|uniref:Uncharacterized protein n=1 Tax=Armillaria gallica TaxID=47427 RepID=A0A2H3D669_ARMGA|nr:hypothetical protein ARMGADRAFT_682627 [Armillaria gallica]
MASDTRSELLKGGRGMFRFIVSVVPSKFCVPPIPLPPTFFSPPMVWNVALVPRDTRILFTKASVPQHSDSPRRGANLRTVFWAHPKERMISGGSSLCTRSPSLRGMETNEQRRRQCYELVVAMSLCSSSL